jgi:hypothetical protein
MSYSLKHRDLSWIMLSRSALQAIVDGRQSAHIRILANDHTNLHVSSNSSQYGVQIFCLLIQTSGIVNTSIHIS